LCLRSIQAEQQPIIEQCRMIDTVVVADERVGDAAKLQQPIPVSVVPGEARDFQSENDPHMGQGNFTGQARKPGSFVGAGAGQSEILIDNDYLLFGPAELTGLVGQRVLSGGGFAIVFDLAGCGLADVNIGGAVDVRRSDFGGISHWSAPAAGVALFGQEAAPESR
jgi:hypothetical protein